MHLSRAAKMRCGSHGMRSGGRMGSCSLLLPPPTVCVVQWRTLGFQISVAPGATLKFGTRLPLALCSGSLLQCPLQRQHPAQLNRSLCLQTPLGLVSVRIGLGGQGSTPSLWPWRCSVGRSLHLSLTNLTGLLGGLNAERKNCAHHFDLLKEEKDGM